MPPTQPATYSRPEWFREWIASLLSRGAQTHAIDDIPGLDTVAAAPNIEFIFGSTLISLAMLFNRVVGGGAYQLPRESDIFAQDFSIAIRRAKLAGSVTPTPRNDFELFRRYPDIKAAINNLLHFAAKLNSHITDAYGVRTGSPLFDLLEMTSYEIISGIDLAQTIPVAGKRRDLLKLENRLLGIYRIFGDKIAPAQVMEDVTNAFKFFGDFYEVGSRADFSVRLGDLHAQFKTASPAGQKLIAAEAYLRLCMRVLDPVVTMTEEHSALGPLTETAPIKIDDIISVLRAKTQRPNRIGAINVARSMRVDPVHVAIAMLIDSYRERFGYAVAKTYEPHLLRIAMFSDGDPNAFGTSGVRLNWTDIPSHFGNTGLSRYIDSVMEFARPDDRKLWGPELAVSNRAFSVFSLNPGRVPSVLGNPRNFWQIPITPWEMAFLGVGMINPFHVNITTASWNDPYFRLAFYTAVLIGGKIFVYQDNQAPGPNKAFLKDMSDLSLVMTTSTEPGNGLQTPPSLRNAKSVRQIAVDWVPRPPNGTGRREGTPNRHPASSAPGRLYLLRAPDRDPTPAAKAMITTISSLPLREGVRGRGTFPSPQPSPKGGEGDDEEALAALIAAGLIEPAGTGIEDGALGGDWGVESGASVGSNVPIGALHYIRAIGR